MASPTMTVRAGTVVSFSIN